MSSRPAMLGDLATGRLRLLIVRESGEQQREQVELDAEVVGGNRRSPCGSTPAAARSDSRSLTQASSASRPLR